MAVYAGPKIIDSGLVLLLDTANTESYPGSGSTWYDLSLTGNHANISTAPTYDTASKSFYFTGTSSTSTLRPASDDFSLCCWFKTTSTSGSGTAQWWSGGPLVDCEIGGVTNDYGLSIGNGKVMLGVGNSDTTIRSPLSYNNNVWHYAVGTRKSSNGALQLYVDTASVATGTARTGSLTGASRMYTGTGYNAAAYTGYISIIQVYNKVLTADEIRQNYNAHRGRYGI